MTALLALLASVVWGVADFLGGATSRRLATARVLVLSQASGLVAISVVLLLGGWRPLGAWLWWGVGAGVCGALATACFYRALAIGTMSVVAPIAGTSLVVPVVAGVLGGERPSTWQVAGIVLATVGVVLASGPELSGVGAQRRAVQLAVLAACGFGGALALVPHVGPGRWAMSTASLTVTSLVLMGAYVLARPPPGPPARGRDAAAVLAIGVLNVAALGLYTYASTRGLVAVVAVLASLYSVVTVLLAQVVFAERLRGIQLWGVLAAFAGVACLAAA
jgi:drug/metabolite transporter (DMT)-like permease